MPSRTRQRVQDLTLMARRLLNPGPDGPPPAVQSPRIRALLDAYGPQDRDSFASGSSNPRKRDQRDRRDRCRR